jgi:hypothetical protein
MALNWGMRIALQGTVASLHLHPEKQGEALQSVQQIEVIEAKGIVGQPRRYFGRVSSRTGLPSKRQVSLIEQEQIAEHAAVLGLKVIPPGAVRANIETSGINLVGAVGSQIQIGDAVLFICEPRDPCEKMDALCQGLRELMMNNRQGVMAQVVRSGKIRVGDSIVVRQPGSETISEMFDNSISTPSSVR